MKRTMTLVICSVIALITCNAVADDDASGWMIGGSAVVAGLDRNDGAIDDTSFGAKAFAQYKFNQWFGLEGSYYNSGEFQSSATSAGGEEFKLVYQGFTAQGVFYIPLPWEEVEFFLRGGYFTFRVDSTINSSNSGNGSDNGAMIGAGFAVRVSESMYFRSAVDVYDADGADLASVELGLEYRF